MRRYTFRPYRVGMGPHFILTTWDAGKTDHRGKHMIRYQLVMREDGNSTVLFAGEDFACSPMHAIDCVAAAECIMSFLTLRPGDTDKEYFSAYTPAQLDYCACHAEALSVAIDARWKDANGNLKSRYYRYY